MEGGQEAHRKTMKGFYAKYRCGKAVTSCQQDKRAHCSPGGESCRTEIAASLSQWTSMSRPSFIPLKCQKGICQIPRRSVIECSMVVLIGWQQRGDQTWQHHIRYPIRIRSEIALTDLGGQHGSETMSCSSHHHHDLAHSFCRATLDDVHRFRFRHRRATETSTRMVRMRHQQVLQSRTHSPSECTSLAEPQAHT